MPSDIVYGTFVNVSGDIETVKACERMGWAGRFIEGWFIKNYDRYTGHTHSWIGDTDEDGEPCGFDTKQDAEVYLFTQTIPV